MKSNFILLALILLGAMARSQNTITVTYTVGNPVGSRLVKTTTDQEVSGFDPRQTITINIVNPPAGIVVAASYNSAPKTVSGSAPSFVIQPLAAVDVTNYVSYDINITCAGESVTYQHVAMPPAPTANTFPTNSAFNELGIYFTSIDATDFGLTISRSSIPGYTYIGEKYSHIFLDQFGKNLMGTIPQGISNRQYVVHIIYLTNRAKPSQISYSLEQTKGSFNSTLIFNNQGQLGNFGTQAVTGTPAIAPIAYGWAHQEFLLRTSTDNIEFEVFRNILNEQGLLSVESNLVAKHTIEMSKVFHGSFDIGLINTTLANPTFQLVPSINDPNLKVVKRENNGNRGVVTAMATFYTSPIVLIEKYIFGMDIPNYKLTGRNFLDDHKIYERIFPAVGVAINDKVFKNLFFGLNWELARGASFFAGIHYGEVSTFNTHNTFSFEETVINEAEFNLRSDKVWEKNWAFGANLDLMVVTNLFKQK